MIGCCDNHKKNGVAFGDCPSHPKVSWNAQSLSFYGTFGENDDLALIMFHDHIWRDKSLQNHLSNPQILIAFLVVI